MKAAKEKIDRLFKKNNPKKFCVKRSLAIQYLKTDPILKALFNISWLFEDRYVRIGMGLPVQYLFWING